MNLSSAWTRHVRAILLTFIALSLLSMGAGLRWARSRTPAATTVATVTSGLTADRGAIERLFDDDLKRTQQQIAAREQALAALDADAAPAGIATSPEVLQRRLGALTAALTRDRSTLAALQAPTATASAPSADLIAANDAVDKAREQLAALEARLTPQHPDVVRQRRTVTERQAEALAAARAVASAPTVNAAARAREVKALTERIAFNDQAATRTRAALAATGSSGAPMASTSDERDRLTRELAPLRAVYAALQKKRDEVASALTAGAAGARSAPVAPVARVAPLAPLSIVLLSLAGSALVAGLVGLVLSRGDTHIYDASDLRGISNVAVLTSVSEIAPLATAPAASERELSSLPEPANPHLVWHPRCPRRTVEQYRRLAHAVRRFRAEHQTRVICVTSALPAEGKTLTAVNLAVSLAEAYRQRVLLIDADLRRPAVAALFSLPAQEGLADWLPQTDEREAPIVRVSARLSIVPAGTPTQEPIPLLTSLRMAMLIASARTDFDWVVIDTPPTGLIADAGTLDASLDGFLVVTASGRSTAAALSQTLAALGGHRVLGLVLNRVRHSEGADSDEYSGYYSAPAGPQ